MPAFTSGNPKKDQNIQYARQALRYCREIIPIENSSTQPLVTDKQDLLRLFDQIGATRARKVKLGQALQYTLMYSDNAFLQEVKTKTKKSKKYTFGNCEELSQAAILYLRKNNITRAETISFINGDHVFVVIDREGDLHNPSTWGNSCVILDVLNNTIFEPSEIYSKLKDYQSGDVDTQPHILKDFTFEDRFRLKIEGEISAHIDPDENRQKLENFQEKLMLIEKVCSQYFDEEQRKELGEMIGQVISREYILETVASSTNFELERLLDKKMKAVRKHIERVVKNPDDIYAEIMTEYFIKYYPLTAIHEAAKVGYAQVVERLLSNRSDLNLPDQEGFLPLHIAARCNNNEALQKILNHNNNQSINDQTISGWTALHLAANNEHLNIVDELYNRGADPFIIDQYGCLPYHYAVMKGNLAMLQLLLSRDANLDYQKNDGWTYLHYAVTYGHIQIVEELLNRGANPYLFNQEGLAPLHLAAIHGKTAILSLLLDRENNFNLNYQKDDGRSLLHLAVHHGQLGVVEELLKRGAEPNLLSNDGVSPLMLAEQMVVDKQPLGEEMVRLFNEAAQSRNTMRNKS